MNYEEMYISRNSNEKVCVFGKITEIMCVSRRSIEIHCVSRRDREDFCLSQRSRGFVCLDKIISIYVFPRSHEVLCDSKGGHEDHCVSPLRKVMKVFVSRQEVMKSCVSPEDEDRCVCMFCTVKRMHTNQRLHMHGYALKHYFTSA